MSLDLNEKPSTAVFWLLRILRVVILVNMLILFFSLNYWGIIYNTFLVSGVQTSAFFFFNFMSISQGKETVSQEIYIRVFVNLNMLYKCKNQTICEGESGAFANVHI